MPDYDDRKVGRIAFAMILIATAIPTGLRSPRIRPQTRLAPLDFLSNVLLYVPFGFAARNRGLSSAMRRGAALSLIIEGAQLFYRGRYATVLDVVANTAGAAIGAHWFRPSESVQKPAE